MDLFSFALFLSIYIYAFFFATELLYIIIGVVTLYSIITIYVAQKNNLTTKNKIGYSFFKNESLGAAMASIDID